ncbi:MAG: UDP-N-acetylmuramoyl-L-alanyl-D-glutamate--2,6-diaminopimelate ligase, partial [Clostridiales bacterium]|nr:UDP-N-acetylmuramoyl-L-alanyl-D-glutamate--2,6-diaminopimelate ligase [Clostridiales bacterium]
MKLSKLIKNLEVVKVIGDTDVDITEICINSNSVTSGSMFICLNGLDFDGHGFALQAERYGARAIVSERETEVSVTQIIVKDARVAMSFLSAEFYGRADREMKLIGVTGTNGKTSTTHIIKSIMDSAGVKCGVIGTLGAFYDNVFIELPLTTPDPLMLHKILFKMKNAGVKVVVMEVSAHALYFDKIEGMFFEVGIFTNLTQDHLDFFHTIDEYERAKLKFFDKSRCKYAVVNADDKVGVKIINTRDDVISYGIENPSDVFAIDCVEKRNGSTFVINLFDMIYSVGIKLIGKFNIYNSLAAATATALVGVKPETIIKGLSDIKWVNGRLELVYDGDFAVFVDYAHTPDGLEKSLSSLKLTTPNRLICVFGCGGNRDREKRP